MTTRAPNDFRLPVDSPRMHAVGQLCASSGTVTSRPAARRGRTPPNRGRPGPVVRLRPQLTVGREIARDGYVLRFAGREAMSSFLDEMLARN
jgi:hypothetical protein